MMNRHQRRAHTKTGKLRDVGVDRDSFSRDLPGLLHFAKALVSTAWERQKSCSFMIIAERQIGKPVLLGFPDGNCPPDELLAQMQDDLTKSGFTRCAKIAEVWTSTIPNDGSTLPELRPSQDPARREAIIIFVRDGTGSRLSSAAEIRREDGVPILLPWDDDHRPQRDRAGLLGIISEFDLADWAEEEPWGAALVNRSIELRKARQH